MLQGIFLIFLFQLIGETIQKFFALTIPGPVIGLLLLLLALLLLQRRGGSAASRIENNLDSSANALLRHLPLLFVPIGVGVVMHISSLQGQLLAVLCVLFVGTVASIGFTALVMQKMQHAGDAHDR